MKKTELLERVYVAHEKLTNALEGLTEEQATRVGLNAQWAIKDALSHIAAWEIEGVRIISEIQAGAWKPQKFDKQAIDEFNAHAVESRRENSMNEVRLEFDEAHREMERSIVSLLPDEVDESSPAYKFVEATTFRHHTSHAGQIEEWKQKMGQG
ncbi:MAG: DinB family protein [Pyrinomonadaceae bacterium]